MARIHLNKGHDLKIKGAPQAVLSELPCPSKIKIVPDHFEGVKPKLLVKLGESVKIGSPLFFDKNNPKILFCSNVAGQILNIKFGDRRKVEFIEISCEGTDSEFSSPGRAPEDFEREDIIDVLLENGLWPTLRQRPFSKIANPDDIPKSIFITAMPTAPFSLDLNLALNGNSDGIDTGLLILAKLASGDINITLDTNKKYSIFNESIEAKVHHFSGPHPSGNVGIHIHHIDPISSKDDVVWYISLQDLNDIGKFFKDGVYPTDKYVSVGGACLSDPAFYKIKKGMLISDILKEQIVNEESMIISGDVLSGNQTSNDMPINFYHEILSVIPHYKKRDFLGWILPGLKKYSLSRTFLSSLLDKKKTNFDTRINGSRRAIIPFGRWEAMLPMDLMPDFIVKSILAKDIEDMEKYGIYECDHEDFSLCAYACQSKVEVSKIIKEGLALMEEEG